MLNSPWKNGQGGIIVLFRKLYSELEQFYSENPKEALLVTGARQIGKSFAIREFGKSHFENFIEINFIEMPQAIEVFNNAKDARDILLRISVLKNQPMQKGKTLIFFDEVQKVPEIVTAIKFLVEEGSYRYALSGSLLGIELKGLRSVPVGFMTIKEMYPLDLEEFFIACGVQPQVFDALKKSFEQKLPVDSFVHEKMMQLFRLYMITGGMPSVVQTYIDTNNIQNVLAVQKSILQMYRKDISQYDPQNKLYIEDIFDLIPEELNSQNKRFILKRLNENLKFSRYEDSFIWLREAGVALPTYNIESPTLPLELAKQRNLFKLFSNDVGLLASQFAQGIQLKILNNENGINFGAIFENTVAQELKAHGFKLFYFNSKKQGELDFVIKLDDEIVPIEVKSGKDYERHNALKNVLANPDYDIKKAYVLCNENLKVSGKITYLPIYMTMFIQNSVLPDFVYKIDLKGM
ncbi:MAG: ATP-binding protein [Treponema sp.]|nr:ATP-binding protein [Treponema sp.]